MTDRQGKGRDCRDGAWLPWGHQITVPRAARRSAERLRAEWWRMTRGIYFYLVIDLYRNGV